MRKQIANMITGCRLVGSVLLLIFPAFSAGFYITYLLCGLSDMVDGTIARKTGSAGKLGSQLDTVADLVFVVAALLKLLPAVHIPGWLWIWGGVIAAIKISNIALEYILNKRFLAAHTIMNKVTGLLLFLLPLAAVFVDFVYLAFPVWAIATFSAIQEGLSIVADRDG